jgi:hypothetical protein
MTIHFVTVATKSDGYFKFFLESCEKNGVDINILGLNKKWRGFGWRWVLVERFLKNKGDEDIVCFLDSYDLIINRNVRDLEKVFRSFNTEFLVSKETNAHILIDLSLKYLMFSSKWTPIDGVLVNAGTWMATKRAFTDMMNEVRTKKEYDFSLSTDDQAMLCKYIVNNKKKIKIDMESKIFLVTISPLFGFFYNKDVTFNGHAVEYRQGTPFFIHCPAKVNMNEAIQKLGYRMTKEEIALGGKTESMYRGLLFTSFLIIFVLMYIITSREKPQHQTRMHVG